ncbi:MAG TPA: SURF1 family protein [Sphingobium sp.]|nr:SURF1 family protein [Sphingobium sp.]
MTQDAPRRRSAGFLVGLSLTAVLLVAGFVSLGLWQVHRLAWKRDLIHKVETRIHALPIPAPRTAQPNDVYLRVTASGTFLNDKATLVQAVTDRGAGFWVMTPLATTDGFTLMINRGFVPAGNRDRYARPAGRAKVAGLLRLSEPGGGFLRANDPAAHRWYSRDVAAMAAAQHVPSPIANYFVDAEAGASSDALPIGGLTVLNFPNSHLSYALTWFALAAMTAGAYMFLMRYEWQQRRA